jgi:hypothetical protein
MAAEATSGRSRPASPAPARVALVAASVTVAMFGVCGVLLLLTRDYQRAVYGAGGTAAALVCLAVGFIVARRQPANPIGWLLLGWALLTPVVGVALLYSVLDYRIHRGTLPFGPVAVLLETAEFGIAVLAALTVLLFPGGQSRPRRWRWVLWVFLAASAAFTASLVARQALAIERHPLGIGPSGAPLAVPAAGGILAPLGWTADGLIVVCWLIIVGRQMTSYLRSTGNRRQQLKWLIGGAVCCVVATGITIFAGNYSSGAAQAVQDAADLGAAALPAAIGVGIVKYRLYDIDRIISRTLAYAIVTSVLVGVYLGLVLLASLVLPAYSPVTVAGSTLVVAALFHPLRRRVQRVVDRRFNRARYDADRIIDAFAVRLRDAVELDAIRDELAGTVHAALEPAHLSVWIKEP